LEGSAENVNDLKSLRLASRELLGSHHRLDFAKNDSLGLVETANRLATEISGAFAATLSPYWSQNSLKGWQYLASDAKTGSGGKSEAGQSELPKEKTLNELFKEFAGLQYSGFIRFAFFHLRNLLGFNATALSLLFVAINSYPFQPYGTLVNAASCFFVITAISIVTVFYLMDTNPILSRLPGQRCWRQFAPGTCNEWNRQCLEQSVHNQWRRFFGYGQQKYRDPKPEHHLRRSVCRK